MNELIVYKNFTSIVALKKKKPDNTYNFCRHTNHRVNANSSMSLAANLKLFFSSTSKKDP